MWFQKWLLYGCIGLLIEVWFTSISSLLRRHWKLTGVTYLWMILPYGGVAILSELVWDTLDPALLGMGWGRYLVIALILVPLWYGAEALSAWTIKTSTHWLQKWFGGTGGGVIPWEYDKSKWSPAGMINLKYFPFWLLLACVFGPLSGILQRVLHFLSTQTVGK